MHSADFNPLVIVIANKKRQTSSVIVILVYKINDTFNSVFQNGRTHLCCDWCRSIERRSRVNLYKVRSQLFVKHEVSAAEFKAVDPASDSVMAAHDGGG